jgi:hypothetical protein
MSASNSDDDDDDDDDEESAALGPIPQQEPNLAGLPAALHSEIASFLDGGAWSSFALVSKAVRQATLGSASVLALHLLPMCNLQRPALSSLLQQAHNVERLHVADYDTFQVFVHDQRRGDSSGKEGEEKAIGTQRLAAHGQDQDQGQRRRLV